MKKLIAFLLSSLFIYFLQAQSPLVKQWDKRFGWTDNESVNTLQQTTDGGFIFGGTSSSDMGGDKSQSYWGSVYNKDYWIVKINAQGIKQWDKRFGGTTSDVFAILQKTPDGGYILGGTSVSDIGGDKTQSSWSSSNDYWIVKIDSLGNKQWDKRFGGTREDYLTTLILTNDGGYLLGGYTYSGIGGDKTEANWDNTFNTTDYWVVKVDSVGNKQWDKRFGGTQTDMATGLLQTTDGGYMIGGYSASGMNGDKSQSNWSGASDYWIVKIDGLGTKQWDKRFGGIKEDAMFALRETRDGGYLLGGHSLSGISGDKTAANWDSTLTTTDCWIIKINSVGTKQWDKTFGGKGTDNFGSIAQTKDNGFLLTGDSRSAAGGNKSENNLGYWQSWIVKTDSVGTLLWEKTLLEPSVNGSISSGLEGIQTREGDYAFARSTNAGIGGYKTQANYQSGTYDSWIIKYSDSTSTYQPMSVNFSSTSAVCAGGPCAGTATAAPINGVPPYTYHWNLGYTTPTITGLCLGNYTVTVTDAANTIVTSTLHISQPLFLSSTFNQSLCQGSTYYFNGQNLASPGTYRDTLTSQHGCDSIVTLYLNAYSLPTVTLSGNPDTICNNSSAITLTGGSPAGGAFSGNGVAGGSFTPSTIGTTTITYTYTDNHSCSNTATENIEVDSCINHNCHAHFTLYPDTTTPHNWFALNQATGAGAITYNWSWGDGNTSPGATPSHTYSAAANYNICLTITDATGCTDTYCDSSTYVYKTENTIITINCVFSLPTGVTEQTNEAFISIYPNPATESVTISVDESLIGSALTITDVTGRKVAGAVLSMVNTQWSMVNFSSGVYFITVANEKGKMTKKLVKQ